MAAKASNPLLAESYEQIRGAIYQVKRLAENRSTLFANGGTESEVLATVDNLTVLRGILTETHPIPELIEVAREEERDANYDFVVEHTALIAEIDAVLTHITNNIPAPRTFTTAQLSSLKTLLDNLSTAIE